jgi:hypothetical protein
VPRRRKCLHVYQYWCDHVFGFMNARIQTWYPFNIQLCINGREWLARQMDRSDMKNRPEGIRIKHRVDGASVKAYNKQGSILRVETTINDPYGFKVYRPKEGTDDNSLDWRPMRKGIADLKRRADVSHQANDRYLTALGVVEVSTSLRGLVQDILKPAALNGQRVRAINPWAPNDALLLETVMRGEFTINGFRNRDLRPILFGSVAISKNETRRRSAAVSRKLRMLRAHGLIKKVQKSHRYHVTDKGRSIIGALLAARNANVDQLAKLAA